MSNQKSVVAIITMALSVYAANAAAFDQYTITDLGSLAPGSANDYSYPFDINDRGDIVGFTLGADGQDHAFLRLRGQAIADLGLGRATSINNRRQFVGWGVSENYQMWQANESGSLSLMNLGNSKNSRFYGQVIKINDKGHVAGIDNDVGVFFWKNGIKTQVDIIDYDSGCTPLSVIGFNNSDDILTINTIYHMASGLTESLGGNHELNGINDYGEVIGWNKNSDMPGYYSTNTGFRLVPAKIPGATSYPYLSLLDINNAGFGVGGGSYATFDVYVNQNYTILGVNSAFIYSAETNTVAKLNTLVLGATSWDLKIATGINDAGQIIGIGINPAGKRHAFLLTPSVQP